MSHGFKLRFDEMREGDPTASEQIRPSETDNYYQTPGHARNVCFVWSNGKRLFLNYAYLISGEFSPNEEKNQITLTFSSHKVLLSGYNLEPLYSSLLDHLPRLISEMDSRYVLRGDVNEVTVLQITVENLRV